MAISDTQFQITIPVAYDEETRATIAVEVIRFIKERTRSGKDKDNNSFKTPNTYSKNYKEHVDFRAAGKSGGPVNLTLTGEMLNSIELLDSRPGLLTFGFTDPDAKDKANWVGDKGMKFMGITQSDLNKILANFPTDDPTARLARNIRTGISESFIKRLLGVRS